MGAVDRPQQPATGTRFSSIWRPAAAAAGLGAEVTFHDLRHYYASLLIQHGESVKVVQKRLGHKSAVETLDTYSHLVNRVVPLGRLMDRLNCRIRRA